MTNKVLIIGGGPAGLAAARTLLDEQVEVVLVEKEESLGGMARELACKGVSECRNCGVCYVIDHAAEIVREPEAEVFLRSEVVSILKTDDGFKVKIKSAPRYVSGSCVGCGKCVDECPVEGKSIHPPVGSGKPQVYWIDRRRCLHFKKDGCERCAAVCPTGAIAYDDRARNVTRDVSKVILAAGMEAIDASVVPRLGYGSIPDVISSVDAERILNEKGRISRPSDGTAPKKVAMVQCVGSRNEKTGVEYCSKFCCKYATKIAQVMMDVDPDMDLDFYFMDLRTLYEPQDDFKRWAESKKRKVEKKKVPQVRLIRSMPSQAYPGEDGGVILRSSGESDAEIVETSYDLVILSVGMRPRAIPESLAQSLGMTVDESGFVMCAEPTDSPSVLSLGAVCEPMDIEETIVRAVAAAASAVMPKGAGR